MRQQSCVGLTEQWRPEAGEDGTRWRERVRENMMKDIYTLLEREMKEGTTELREEWAHMHKYIDTAQNRANIQSVHMLQNV